MKNDYDTLNDFIYFFKFAKSNRDMHVYDINKKKFSVHQMSMELPLNSKILTVSNERMFMIGGLKGGSGSNRRKSLKLTWEYLFGTKTDLNEDIVESKQYSEAIRREDMHQERYDHCLVYDDNNKAIYSLGGFDGRECEYLDHCEKYTFLDDTWTQIRPMWKKKLGFSACLMNNKFIYAFGGFTERNVVLNDIEKFNTFTNNW